jgi:DNA-binding HxlR family transcriptional regulator
VTSPRTGETVKERILELLYQKSPRRFTEIMNTVEKPNRTVYVSLRELERQTLVVRKDHMYSISKTGSHIFMKGKMIKEIGQSLEPADYERAVPVPKAKGKWVWVPVATFKTLDERARRQQTPIWSIIDMALNVARNSPNAERSHLANAHEVSEARRQPE